MAKAAVTRSIRDDHQKNFLKICNGLSGKHSRWEIWEDFVTLTAIEISNSTDKVNATERTKMYQTIISKYSAKERDGMAEMLAEVAMGMEKHEIVVGYNVGDHVRIVDGPLASFTGVVEDIEPEKNQVSVMVSMFGRETPVELELDQVEVLN